MEPLNLTYTSYITMLALWEKDDVTVKELGKRLTLDSGTLTPLLKKLESLSYIDRIRSSNDERNVYVRLTNQGRALKKAAAGIPEQMICSTNIQREKAIQLWGTLHELMNSLSND
uniref:MarR family winged helix-turn-helix transcriptional regulator n=1 Tax=Aminipila terrae TaxID=2697030 RepID=UPI002ED37548